MHSLLRRQVRRFLGDPNHVQDELKGFLEAVETTYQLQDASHKKLEGLLQTLSREVSEGNQLLTREQRQRVLAERRLEHSLSMFRATLESTADGILVIGSDRSVESWNGRLLEMWGLQPQDLEGVSLDQAAARVSAQVKNPERFMSTLAQLRDLHAEYQGLVALLDGRAFEVCCKARLVAGCSVGQVWSFRDFTEERRAEQRQAEADALRALNRAKDDLLDTVAHELRTPLTSIRSYSELLLAYDDPAVRNEFLQVIVEESDRLSRLVSNVLDLRKIELGEMEWSMAPVDLNALLDRVARAYRPLFTSRDLRFDYEVAGGLPRVTGDEDRLRQVLDNLLNNALKFTPNGMVGLSAEDRGAEVLISVRDTGPGIPAADHERIFARFQQGGSVLTGKPYGTGLGLAICREIVGHHGGRIWVESECEQGSVFNLALPTGQPE